MSTSTVRPESPDRISPIKFIAMISLFCIFGWTTWSSLQPTATSGSSAIAVADSQLADVSEIPANDFILTDAGLPSDFQVELIPIEEMEVGQRVRAAAATDDDDLSLGMTITPSTWKKLTFTAQSNKGTTAHIVLLRPDEWVEQQQAAVGNNIHLVVPEVMDADALIHSIERCPEIIDGPGQVVTGTFRHECADNVELIVDGEPEPIRCTSGHPFWSEDRQDYLPAASFTTGEQLRTASGLARVLEVKDLPGTVPVYNLEVHVRHVYHVGESGVLTHNTGPCRGLTNAQKEIRGIKLKGWKIGQELKHYDKHGRAMGFPSKKAYTDAAKALAKKTKNVVEAKVGNTLFKFDKDTGNILIINGKGRVLKTFHPAHNGIESFKEALRAHRDYLITQGH